MIWLAVIAGVVMAAVFRFTTHPARISASLNNIHADLLEFRLYFDEPALIWRAQINLIRDNCALLLQFVPALLIIAAMMYGIETLYSDRPLRPGEAAVVTVQLNRPLATSDRFELEGQTETPPVRILHDNQVSWRVRAVHGGRLSYQALVNGAAFPARLNYPRRDPWLLSFVLISSASALVLLSLFRRKGNELK